jgi:DNA polymerase IV (DinB-like DNA polymerase)
MRIIGHLDMDAFFASVEERDNPRLAGRPLVIGSDPEEGRGRGVVSTANYKAREYGIRSALPISTAWRLSETARAKGLPPATFLEVDMHRYGEASQRIMAIVRKHAEHVEEASVDEAYFDLSFAANDGAGKAMDQNDAYEKAALVAHAIKDEIRARERLTASVGIGPNKLIAKIASDKNKPDGFCVVRENEAEEFLASMAIRKIPGVGPKTEEELKKLGVRTVADAKKFSEPELYAMFGKWGNELYEKLRGRSDAEIVEEWEAKSIGEQETFMHDTRDANIIQERLIALAQGVHGHFAKSGFTSFGSVTITVRFADFTTKTRSATLAKPASDAATLPFEAMRLFAPFFDKRENPQRKDIRLIGVRIEKLA